jgi:hypothetical protein
LFKREHHIRIATILQALNAELLREHRCWFGGGTAIALSHGEYRESVDIDFLVSDKDGYQGLRQLLKSASGIEAITRPGMEIEAVRDIRTDQYGIRTMLRVAETEIKFEIVFEGRIELDDVTEKNQICGISTLTPLDMATSKLLANSDRWSDDSVFSRDIIDLAMLELPRPELKRAIEKATAAYGKSVVRDLAQAIDALRSRRERLADCMTALKMENIPQAVLWQRIRGLR